MPLDPSKLRTYLGSTEPRVGRRALPVVKTVKPFLKPGQDMAALRDRLARGEHLEDDQIGRLLDPKVGYMELGTPVVGFVCGNCGYYDGAGNCRNPCVLAPVAEERGCCNLFWNEDVTFPPAAKG